MLPPKLSASYRHLALRPSKSVLQVLRQAPQLSALVLIGAGSFPANQVQSLVARQRRGCFFGRHRVWHTYLDPSFQRYLERRRKTLKYRCTEALHRKSFWGRVLNRPTCAWKKSSGSWGFSLRDDYLVNSRPGGRWVSSENGTSRGAKGDPGGGQDNETRRGRLEKRMEEIRRMVDEDSFRTLFGYSMRNLGRYSSGGAHEDPNGLLDRGRRYCSDIVSRFGARDRGGGRDGVEERASSSGYKSDVEGNDRTNAASEGSAQRGPDRSSPQAATTDEFEFDPITMRRVPRRAKADLDAVDSALRSHERSMENLEKPSSGYEAQTSTSSGATAHEDPVDTELSKYTPASSDGARLPSNTAPPTEQFRDLANAEPSKHRAKRSRPEGEGSTDRNVAPKVNSSLPKSVNARVSSLSPADIPRVRDFEIPPEPPFEGGEASANPSRLHYDSSEPRVEDLDLLRPSDVRASMGILKGRDAEALAERRQDRERLEDEFRKTAEREASCAEEAEAMKVLQKRNDRHRVTSGNDESDAVPWIQEATRVQDAATDEPAVEVREGDIYSQTPQGLETCYDREVKAQRALLREAEADGYGRTPQGLETSYARETGRHSGSPQRLQTSLDRKIKDRAVSRSETGIYGHDNRPTGLETSYAREMEDQKMQTEDAGRLESWDELPKEGRQRVLFSESDKKVPARQSDTAEMLTAKSSPEAQGSELTRKENDEFIPRVEDDPVRMVGAESSSGSSTQREYSVWGNRNPKWAAKKLKRQRDRDLAKELQAIYEDTYGVINAEHRMQPRQTKASDQVSPDTSANEAPECNLKGKPLGPDEFKKSSGGDGLEAGVLAQSQPQNLHENKTSEHHSSEELAMGMEEQEQILHEEVREVDDILHEVQSELDAIKAKSPAHADSHPVVYKILAYDPAVNELTSGSTTSSIDSEILSPSEVIPRLTNPAKFLPSLTALKKEGYEIVSGGKNVLVLKRVHEGPFIEEEDPIPDDHPHHLASSSLYPLVNPIDGTTVTGNFASPTGFVNHDAIFSSSFTDTDTQPLHEPPPPPAPPPPPPPPPPSLDAARSPSSSSSPADKVKREEPVFSGRSKWQDVTQRSSESRKEKAKKAAKRVFWVGLWVAGCSYAVGVTGEFFRTGGADGAGPQWFSGFH